MSTFDRLSSRQPRTASVTLAEKPEDADRLNKARQELDQAKTMASMYGDDDSMRNRLADAEDELERVKKDAITFTVYLAGIGPSAVKELIEAHPPTDKEKREARKKANGNPGAEPEFHLDTFAPALLAATVTKIVYSDALDEPLEGLTLEQATAIWEGDWPHWDKTGLFNKAMELDTGASLVEDLGKD